MTTPRAIGLAGKAGVGKSSVARALVEFLPEVEILGLGEPIKVMLRAYYEFSTALCSEEIEARLNGSLKETPCRYLQGRTPRHAMQTLGTEWGREILDPALWVAAWRRRAQSRVNRGLVPVNDSVRFLNEIGVVRELGGVVVLLTDRDGMHDVGAHISEEADGLRPFVDGVVRVGSSTPREAAEAVLTLCDSVSRANRPSRESATLPPILASWT